MIHMYTTNNHQKCPSSFLKQVLTSLAFFVFHILLSLFCLSLAQILTFYLCQQIYWKGVKKINTMKGLILIRNQRKACSLLLHLFLPSIILLLHHITFFTRNETAYFRTKWRVKPQTNNLWRVSWIDNNSRKQELNLSIYEYALFQGLRSF